MPGTTSYIGVTAFALYYAFDLWVSVILNRILNTRLPHFEPSRIKIACGKEKETWQVEGKLLAEAGFKLEIRQKSITKGLYCKSGSRASNQCSKLQMHFKQQSLQICKDSHLAELCDVASNKCIPESRGQNFQSKVEQKN